MFTTTIIVSVIVALIFYLLGWVLSNGLFIVLANELGYDFLRYTNSHYVGVAISIIVFLNRFITLTKEYTKSYRKWYK